MAVRFQPDGSIVVDSVEEAIQFETRRKSAKAKPKGPAKSHIGPGWDGFCEALSRRSGTGARKVLALVKGAGTTGIAIAELARFIEVTPGVINGTISGIAKTARAAGLDFPDIIVRCPNGLYRPGSLLGQRDPPVP